MIDGKQRVRGHAPASFFSRKWLWLVVPLILAIGLTALSSLSFPALTIRQLPSGNVVFQTLIRTDDPFKLKYIHSIHRTPVEEHFHMNDKQQIVLDSMVFDSYGVGIPSSLEGGQTFRFDGGKMRLENIDRVLDHFDLRIGQVIANHTLYVEDRIIPLSQVSKPGSAVRFEVDNLSLFSYLRGALLHGE